MKKIILTFIIFLFFITLPSSAKINTALYNSMSAQSYRNNYYRQTSNKQVPYWQAQANYTTRNRMYSDYSSFQQSVNNSNYTRYYRGR